MSQARLWIFSLPETVNEANSALGAYDPSWGESIVASLPPWEDIDAPPPEPILYIAGWQDDESILETVRDILDPISGVRMFAGAVWGIEEESDVSDDDTMDPGPYDKVTQRAATAIAARQLGVNLG